LSGRRGIGIILHAAKAVLLILTIGTSSAFSQTITVAAASDLRPALQEIATKFEHQKGVKVSLVFGSSGNLQAQVRNGAPFDVFLSADSAYTAALVKDGLANKPVTYAYGFLVAYGRTGLSDAKKEPSLKDLLTGGSVQRIAIANPEHAPYGRAAIATLRSLGIESVVAGKLVMAENVAQAVQFVDSGNAQIGLVAGSLVSLRKAPDFSIMQVPLELYPPIEQTGVVVRASKQPKAAAEFLAFLSSPEAREVLQRFGFRLPAQRTSVDTGVLARVGRALARQDLPFTRSPDGPFTR